MSTFLRSSPRSRRAILLAALLLLAVPARAGATSSPAGSATTENKILSVTVGDRNVTLASDTAESELGAQIRGHASFVAGATTDSRVGVAEKTATTASEAGTDSAAVGALSLDDLLALTIVEAGVDVAVATDAVSSSAAATLADVDLLDGMIGYDGLTTLSATDIDGDGAAASRVITLDGVSLMRVGPLLDQMGFDPHSLACGALEDGGATLGVATSQACEELSAAEGAIDDAGNALAAASTDLDDLTGGNSAAEIEADRAAAEALSCAPLNLVCIAAALDDLLAIATAYSITLSDPTDLNATQAEVVAALDDALVAAEDSEVVDEALTAIADGTCSAADDAIDAALADVSGDDPANLAGALTPIRTELNASCAALAAILDAFLDAPLLSFDGVEISLAATATANAPDSAVEVSIGSIKVGLNDSTEVGVEDVEAVAEEVGSQVEQFFADLGFGFSAPEIDLLVIEQNQGQDGSEWFADASFTMLRLTVPGDNLTVPDDAPLGVLDGGAGSAGAMHAGIFGAAAGAVLAAVVPSPDTVVEAGVFSVGSAFSPSGAAGDDTDDGDDDGDEDGDDDDGEFEAAGNGGDPTKGPFSLPSTGAALLALLALALLLTVGGAHVRRYAEQRH